MLEVAAVTFGIVMLIAGGATLVHGATTGGIRMGMSPMVVGLTIVAFGTSAPELVISVVGALRGQSDLVFGNIVGSNIANLGLILGLSALVMPVQIHGQLVRRELPLLLLATTVMTVMALDDLLRGMPAMIDRADSLILLLLFCVFLYVISRDIVRTQATDSLLTDLEANPLVCADWKAQYWWLLIVAGIGLLYAGGELAVTNSVVLAEQFGLSKTVVGLFALAIGTSLPELVTSVYAAVRGESDLAVGNVVGSNIFNSLFVLPVSALVGSIAVPEGGPSDLVVSWMFTAVLIPIFFLGNARLGRPVGTIILLAYGAYFIFRLAS